MRADTERPSWVLDVAQLAELDMAAHGRRLIIGEFAAGVILCVLLGAMSLGIGLLKLKQGPGWQLWLGIELIFVGFNYVPLLLIAVKASRDEEAI